MLRHDHAQEVEGSHHLGVDGIIRDYKIPKRSNGLLRAIYRLYEFGLVLPTPYRPRECAPKTSIIVRGLVPARLMLWTKEIRSAFGRDCRERHGGI